ncbi:MAG: ABC transporter permease [Candidatus Eisenbacteria bacterium]|uniref:ABC transporter permease n=1 Tax=Eiseniibacteriota bacterium TaxID=2212470 RepID=A0A956M0E7_UNCEI|nr:ABC transporter permease [Candidatus Eisenbacteria bacterium]
MARSSLGSTLASGLGKNLVPLLFATLCVTGILWAKISIPFLLTDVVPRLSRNLFLVLSLIIPVVAGMGLNFGIVIGAMCGQVGLILVENAGGQGLGALGLAMGLSLPLSLFFGWLTGLLLNRAKGREMITGMILGFFANGVYQAVFLLLAGPVLPFHNQNVLLDGGVGLVNTIDLVGTGRQLDALIRPSVRVSIFPIYFPVATILVSVLLCFAIRWYLRTKSGQDLRAVGQDMHVAEISGIGVDRSRVRAIMISTCLGGIGQIIFLSSWGTFNTYQSHEQVGPYAIAALLVGGATVVRATIWHAILGTLLFHTLISVVSIAGQTLVPSSWGGSQIGEYIREFLVYAVIAVTLALHAWRAKKA